MRVRKYHEFVTGGKGNCCDCRHLVSDKLNKRLVCNAGSCIMRKRRWLDRINYTSKACKDWVEA